VPGNSINFQTKLHGKNLHSQARHFRHADINEIASNQFVSKQGTSQKNLISYTSFPHNCPEN